MRSHLRVLPIPPKIHQLSARTELALSSSSSEEEKVNREEEEEEEEEVEKSLVYGLRENPKKSFKLADPGFSFAADAGSVVQDRESETESKNPTRKRSKRIRKVGMAENQNKDSEKRGKLKSRPSWTESEPVSSVSDTSPEEDVAMCLMMLSRGIWMGKDEESEEKFRCESCSKVFSSYQALGGHRAGHKKVKSCCFGDESEASRMNAGNVVVVSTKIHQCSLCFRVFGSGQALGGHKRSHLVNTSTTSPSPSPSPASASPAAIAIASTSTNCAKFSECLIDLNLPAPMEDEDFSQLEDSAVSDAEFINPIKY